MDQPSINRVREELTKLTNYIARNAAKLFVAEYETPGQDYIEKARS
jgi:mortality factor 4-like protein 1